MKDKINGIQTRLHVDQKTSSTNYPTAPIPSASRDNELIVFINQGWSAFELGDIVKASETIFLGIDKAFNTPQFSNTELEAQLKKVMESWNQLKMPSGTLYGWARRMEQREWWTWAIYFYDYAGADESGGTNLHARQNSILKAAAIRMDRGIEPERAIQAFQWIISALPDSSFAEEAKDRLNYYQA